MSEPAIQATQLQKAYRIPVREPGVGNALRALFHPTYQDVPAVTGIDFKVARGEMVGFTGPNGAGKTTTLKMLSGLLVPTGGEARVTGCLPHRRDPAWLKTIALVMGNKSQLNLSLTVMDSFDITREIYGVSKPDCKGRLDELVELLDIGELLPKMARNLSLGERAKCEFANALLYQPSVLFLTPSLAQLAGMDGFPGTRSGRGIPGWGHPLLPGKPWPVCQCHQLMIGCVAKSVGWVEQSRGGGFQPLSRKNCFVTSLRS